MGPGQPVRPCGPCGPITPCAPVEPAGPVGPVGPTDDGQHPHGGGVGGHPQAHEGAYAGIVPAASVTCAAVPGWTNARDDRRTTGAAGGLGAL